MHKIEERLALLEHRMALLESQKAAVELERTPFEESLSNLGLVYLLTHAHDRLVHEPHFDGYDDFLEGLFKCKITANNRMEYAYKLKKASDNILDKAADVYQKAKKKLAFCIL
jgi:hypothetical protein